MKNYFTINIDQPISKIELLSYINEVNPKTYVIFSLAIEKKSLVFNVYHYHDMYVDITKLFIEEVYFDVYVVNIKYFYRYWSVDELLEMIGDKYYLDLKTIYNIANRRNCEKISSGYSKEFTLSNFKIHSNIKLDTEIDLYTYFDLCKQLIYYSYNYDLLQNQYPDSPFEYHNIDTITFNELGDIVEDKSRINR